jgi:hypothetical protein
VFWTIESAGIHANGVKHESPGLREERALPWVRHPQSNRPEGAEAAGPPYLGFAAKAENPIPKGWRARRPLLLLTNRIKGYSRKCRSLCFDHQSPRICIQSRSLVFWTIKSKGIHANGVKHESPGLREERALPWVRHPKVTALKGRKPPALHILGSLQKQKNPIPKGWRTRRPFCF